MKIDTRKSTPRGLFSSGSSRFFAGASGSLAAACLLLGTSCVTQARYDESMQEVQLYQRGLQDLESYVGSLERENELLQGRLRLFEEAGTIESSYTADIDERLAELQRIASGITSGTGASPGDVTVLSVEGGWGLRLSDAVLFASGRCEILPEGREILVKMAGEIAGRPHQRIWVRGHTDSDRVVRPETRERFPHGNLQLSAARAVEVAAILREQEGIDPARIIVAGFGPNEPVAPNDSAENKGRNRRVEIFVIEDESAQSGN
jgi:chemotaxis protein MotB